MSAVANNIGTSNYWITQRNIFMNANYNRVIMMIDDCIIFIRSRNNNSINRQVEFL